ncbi:hypothetical protein B0I35DRAFT_485420 [Stachybotrys elegans]|uniref:Uncharacterized protein n=1 Tax=Stachybotrys elegans TaxID=80388 RepID=A0A8K0WJN6_9HYPO|nr:hypothetical protein B0I35DRAFT_485420 [Stachybotrys elegans]
MLDPLSLEASDPFGVTGTWYRYTPSCWSFYRHGYVPDPEIDRTQMRIYVTKIEPPGPNDGQALPVVHFAGISKRVTGDGTVSRVRGTVRLTEEGEVNWTLSIICGEERRECEGIQIGGVRSARGVLGNWHDIVELMGTSHLGPMAFHKISDEYDRCEEMEWEEGDWLEEPNYSLSNEQFEFIEARLDRGDTWVRIVKDLFDETGGRHKPWCIRKAYSDPWASYPLYV